MKLEHSEQARVPAAEAERRALAVLREDHLTNAATVADAIWPAHRMNPQGAGAAASRILVRLRKAGLVAHTVRTHGRGGARTWTMGWRRTGRGR